jgi:hypothetical protein
MPIFGDWPHFEILMPNLDKACDEIDWDVFVIAIDDGSMDESNIGSRLDGVAEDDNFARQL